MPWATGFCPLPFPSAGDRWFRACCRIETFGDNFVIFGDISVFFGDISVIFGDNIVIFGDIIPYPDCEAKQPVRRSYQPRTY